MNCATKAQANTNTVLGAIGTAGALMPNLFNGLFGCGYNQVPQNVVCSENTPVTRYELGLQQKISAGESENALLRSQIYTDGKIVDTYALLENKINNLAAEVRQNKDAQCAVNSQQAVYNGATTATIQCIQNEVNTLIGMTRTVIPCENVMTKNACPTTTTTPTATA